MTGNSDMTQEHILIVDDEREMLISCQKILSKSGYQVTTALNGIEAVKILKKKRFDVVLTDMKMPGMDGIAVLKAARTIDPDQLVILITGYGTIETAVEAMKAGAFDYVSKPFNREQLNFVVEKALDHKRLVEENRNLRSQLQTEGHFENIIGKSQAMEKVFETIRRIATTPINIVIRGESGTGKELIARSIHSNSDRAKNSFVPVNCGALPEPLFESELFGHEKGAFTGAHATKPGLLEFANGGTFFLDEVCELTPSLQVKLLRMTQEQKIRRVGGNKEIDIDVRIISATNQDFEKAVAEKRFREDLYYRLNIFSINLPPLRDRREDIPLLATHFLQTYAKSCQRNISGLEPDALETLQKYDWPGNVRELQNVIERAVSLTTHEVLRKADFPEEVLGLKDTLPGISTQSSQSSFKESKKQIVESFEQQYLIELLMKTGGNISQAAQEGGIERRTFHRLLNKYSLKASDFS